MRGEVGLRDCARRRTAGCTSHGDLRIGPAGQAGDLLGGENRPGIRHIEAAIAGKAGQRHLDEAERRGLAPGGDVAQRRHLELGRTLVGRPGLHKRP